MKTNLPLPVLRFAQRAALAAVVYLLGCAVVAAWVFDSSNPVSYLTSLYRLAWAGLFYAVPVIVLVGFTRPVGRGTALSKFDDDDFGHNANSFGTGPHGEIMKNGHDMNARPFGMSADDH